MSQSESPANPISVTPSTLDKPAEQQQAQPAHDPKFEQLVKTERALRAELRAAKQRESEWQQKQEQESWRAKYEQLEKQAQEDPWAFVKNRGASYDKITEKVLEESDPVAAKYADLQRKIEQMERQQQEQQQKAQEQQSKQYQQAIETLTRDVKSLVASGDEFEAIRDTGSFEAVVELIKSTFEESGELLTVEQAARDVEEYLVEQATRMAALKKVQSKLTPQPATEAISGQQSNQSTGQQQSPVKTLTNQLPASNGKPLSARERAMLAFQGKLSS